MAARTVQNGVVFRASKQVILGLGEGEGGRWMEGGVEDRRVGEGG